MLTVTDITPIAQEGQYWATTHPLGLIKITQVHPMNECGVAKMWYLGSPPEEQISFMGSFLETARLLRHSLPISTISGLLFTKLALRTGDVFVCDRRELVFVSMERVDPDPDLNASLWADWDITHLLRYYQNISLFQRGPVDPDKEPTTRLQRVLEDPCR